MRVYCDRKYQHNHQATPLLLEFLRSELLDELPVEAAMNMNEELLQQRFMHNILLIVDRTVAPTMSVLKTDSPFSTSDEL